MQQSFANIDFHFNPIKYELSVATGSTITRPATLTNNSDEPANIITGKSDFQSSGDNGVPFFLITGNEPDFVRRSEVVFPDQWISTWITIDTPGFTINPWESKTINFTLDVPVDATPGGHYGAVFFKNQNPGTSSSWNISIKVDYWVLILVNVEGDIIIDWELEEVQIFWWWSASSNWVPQTPQTQTPGSSSENQTNPWPNNQVSPSTNQPSSWNQNGNQTNNWPSNQIPEPESIISPPPSWEQWWFGITTPSNSYDDCPLGDFTSSNFDGKCIDIPFVSNDDDISERQENIPQQDPLDPNTPSPPIDTPNKNEEEDFTIGIDIPFKNTGTTHVKPSGKIILKDSDGTQLKQVGREAVINDLGVIVWENIVDYIPINDTRWNVLPQTRRLFNTEWKWFPYKAYSPEWELIVKYWDPGTYYTRQNKQEAGFLMFWERVCEARKHKTITAFIDVWYTNENWEEIEFNAAEEFDIQYTEEYIGLNPYVIIPLLFLVVLLFGYFFLFWILAGKKKRRCKNCDTPIWKNWKVCPKCKKKIK